MSPKYPSLPFSTEDVRQLMKEVGEYVADVAISVTRQPTKADEDRLCVLVWGFRRAVRLGEKSRVESRVYLPSGRHSSLDHAAHEALWKLWQDVTEAPHPGGHYTELIPGFRPR